ncbi:DUF4142 domain-containing protein [Marinoscillum furvescens]|uniref:Uncharacterized protein DUF4142 n=1 Tax=Marinoscillum furvescens DSM 4134 TaxID=1122208 RepID=A0A3D9KW93_MARFU|nr:DUF4142 domain-containing protein [Marinoscillum furvescens]RED91905.1 uncharacterized protein DUF4142 [Marinoscillum furvescens DSM 4134]
MKHLYSRIIPIVLILISFGCQTNSYYAAMNTNQQRHGGWSKDDADLLVKSHDIVLFLESSSAVAQDKAELKDVYLLAEDLYVTSKNLRTDYRVESTIHRTKLASALSKSRDELLERLKNTPKDEFDNTYLLLIDQQLDELNELMVNYQNEGHTDRLKDFADKVLDTYENYEQQANELASL